MHVLFRIKNRDCVALIPLERRQGQVRPTHSCLPEKLKAVIWQTLSAACVYCIDKYFTCVAFHISMRLRVQIWIIVVAIIPLS